MGTFNNKRSLEKRNIIFGALLSSWLMSCLSGATATDMSSEVEHNRSLYYVCPPDFVRLGNSCYFFSTTMATWQDAHFACKDKESNLTAPQRWEDRNLREYLSKSEIDKRERWIGGVYDWEAKAWKWGGEMKTMNYQSFSRMRLPPGQDLRWHCVAMIPELHYRWAPKSCVEGRYYICQTRLRKVRRSERNKLRQKWNPNGTGNKPNEVSVPNMIDHETYIKNINSDVNPTATNDVNRRRKIHRGKKKNNRIGNDVSTEIQLDTTYDVGDTDQNIGKTAYAHRQDGKKNGTKKNNKKKLFRGYVYDKNDPEAAYIHNVNALKSGKSGLTPAQVDKHLRRLERLRKREERAKTRKERLHDELNRQRNSHLDGDAPDTLLSSKVNTIRSRNSIDDKRNERSKKKNKGKLAYTFENVTQKTYVMNNQLSALHPKTIVEVHDFSD